MPVSAANLIAKVRVDGAQSAESQLLGVGNSANIASGKLSGLALGAVAMAGAAVVGLGATAAKMAGDFQSSMTSLVTGAGESQKNLQGVSNGILKMAVDTGTSTKQLSDGMYMIESAGYHGAAGLAVLQAAAQGAKVGNADLGTVADGVTTILTDFGNTGINASQAVNALITTVASGKTHMADLSASLAMILPTASAAHVGLTDVSAAMATMTGEGTPAADAATYLRQTIMSLENPAAKSSKVLSEIGLTAKQVSNGMKQSLPGTLAMITDHLKKKFPEGSSAYVKALSDIAGGSKQMQGILELTGTHLSTFKDNVTGITDAVKKGGSSITGWANVQSDFNFKMDKAKEVVETLMISVGTKLLPVLGGLMDKATQVVTGFMSWEDKTHGVENALGKVGSVVSQVSGFVGGLITGIAKVVGFFQQNELAALALLIPLGALSAVLVSMAVTAIAGFIATIPALLAGFGAWVVAAGAAAIATIAATWPLLAIGAVVALVVAGIILAVQHWGDITRWFQGVWGVFTSWFMGVLHAIGSFVGSVVGDIVSFWQSLPGNVMGFLQSLPGRIMDLWNSIINDATQAGSNILKGIASGIMNAIHFVGDAIGNVTKFISDHLPHSPAKIGPLKDLQLQGSNIVDQMAQGMLSNMPKLQTTISHVVQPVSDSMANMKSFGTSGFTPQFAPPKPNITIIVQPAPPADITLDGHQLTRAQMPYIANAIRNGVGAWGI